jgi:hypothetical protein
LAYSKNFPSSWNIFCQTSSLRVTDRPQLYIKEAAILCGEDDQTEKLGGIYKSKFTVT